MYSYQHKSIRKKTTVADTLLSHITSLWPIFDFNRSYGGKFYMSSDSWGRHFTSSSHLTSFSFLSQSILQGHKTLSCVWFKVQGTVILLGQPAIIGDMRINALAFHSVER